MPVPDYADPRPAYSQIAGDLRDQIKNGRYHPGDRLPSLRALSQTYGVVTETINKALRVLADEKLVQSQSTRGTFVLREPSGPEADPGTASGSASDRRLSKQIGALGQELQRLAGRVEAAEAQAGVISELREAVAGLRAQVMNLYHSVGQPYPYEGDTTEPSREVG
jgi:DNA-binding GntR family transcriptional regulator